MDIEYPDLKIIQSQKHHDQHDEVKLEMADELI